MKSNQSQSGGPSREERVRIIEESIHGEKVDELFNKRRSKLLAVQAEDDEAEWLHRLVDATTTLVDSVNGCTPYFDVRKAATEVSKLIQEGFDNYF